MTSFAKLCEALAEGRNGALVIAMAAVLLRLMVGLHGYSGESTPPMFGDYEAQRHWMEVTIHTPIKEWYMGGPQNNLTYWGLDYPPLTAYQSFIHGCLLHLLDPQTVALGTSTGHESAKSKMLMRWTVLSSDVIIFFPAALAFVAVYYKNRSKAERIWALAAILCQPAFILIDHGHFQFNCISLGLAMAAVAAILRGQEIIGSILFCLSLNHKQMSMYYAPAFFAHLLGHCLKSRRPLRSVLLLGLTVLATFCVCWAPFLSSTEAALQVLNRLAPLSRGLYEDHVANFWCSTSVAIKWKQLFSVHTLARMALGMTVLAALPAMVQQILWPSPRGFLLALLNCSFAFYMFAFQVHEKSILLPLLPASMLALEEPILFRWFTTMAAFSMFPLLKRDRLAIAYGAILLLFNLVATSPKHLLHKGEERREPRGASEREAGESKHETVVRVSMCASIVGAIALHGAAATLPPPSRYPYLHQALMVSYSFAHFVPFLLYTNWRQWRLDDSGMQIGQAVKRKLN